MTGSRCGTLSVTMRYKAGFLQISSQKIKKIKSRGGRFSCHSRLAGFSGFMAANFGFAQFAARVGHLCRV